MKLLALFPLLMCLVPLPCPAAEGDLHETWDRLLRKHVDTAGRVNYRGLQEGRGDLQTYLDRLAGTSTNDFSRDEKLAFWINAYNAFTVELILRNYPLKSIRDIENPWKQRVWAAAGGTHSLDEIEHKILREQLKEPRIHFAIVCASIGCPALWNQAYAGKDIDAHLQAAARRFMRSNKYVQMADLSRALRGPRRVLSLSRIFKWFGDDFTAGGTRSVADFVAEYVDKSTGELIRSAGSSLVIDYLDYDWGLNEQGK